MVQGWQVELLPNGLVRVDGPSGLVTMWELSEDGHVSRRSGQGSVPVSVLAEVERAWL